MNNPFPIGGIIKFSGAVSEIPAGWHLSDGSTVLSSDGNGGTTVWDFRGKFVIGAGRDLAVGKAGSTVSPTAAVSAASGHSHSALTDAQGALSHSGVTGGRALSGDQMPLYTRSTVVFNV